MARDREHFELPRWQQALPRRRRGGGRPVPRNRSIHGQELIQQVEEVSNHLQARLRAPSQGIDPKLVFKLRLNPKGNLDETQLKQLGLRLLARDSNRAIVVFPDEATLSQLRRHLTEYSGLVSEGHEYPFLTAIDAVQDLTKDDRTGSKLKANPLAADEVAALDIELWHSGDRDECRLQIDKLRAFLIAQSLSVADSWVGDSLCLVRAKVNSRILNELLDADYIREIDRRALPTFEMLDVIRMDVSDLDIETEVEDDLRGVLIIDSGVMQRHPLLSRALGDAQVFPDRLRTRIAGGADDGDSKTGGHGTAVAGIAIYDDFGNCLSSRVFRPSARIFSARLTDDQNEYDENELVEHQLEQAIEYFLTNYAIVRVVNISLGDSKLVYSDGAYQFRFAAAIDELAYRHRDREVVWIVSGGNFWPDQLTGEQILNQYPKYLLESPASRVIDPGTSALALTVGGLSYGSGGGTPGSNDNGTERLIAGEKGWPSPFTRTGWGIDGAVKPDVVEYAGDVRFERGRALQDSPVYAGLPTIAKNFAPPNGRLFRTVAGTSFSAPRVANLAVRLFREFPNASSNLIRALIADSARLPKSRPLLYEGKKHDDEDILKVYGYGQPDFSRARWSAQNEVLLLTDGTIELDSFQLYTLPALPQEFLRTRGNRYISVSLAYDPPTRHTRGDSYLGVTMQFAIFRNVLPDQIADAIRTWNHEEREDLEADLPSISTLRRDGDPPIVVDMKPGPKRRKKGTLQRAFHHFKGSAWQYDGRPLVLAVICQRKWAPTNVTNQRFAVVASLCHDDPAVDVYARVQQQARLFQRVRVQV